MWHRRHVLIRELPHRLHWVLSVVRSQSSSIRSRRYQPGCSTGRLEPILHQQPGVSSTAHLHQSATVRAEASKPTVLELSQHRCEPIRPCVAKQCYPRRFTRPAWWFAGRRTKQWSSISEDHRAAGSPRTRTISDYSNRRQTTCETRISGSHQQIAAARVDSVREIDRWAAASRHFSRPNSTGPV